MDSERSRHRSATRIGGANGTVVSRRVLTVLAGLLGCTESPAPQRDASFADTAPPLDVLDAGATDVPTAPEDLGAADDAPPTPRPPAGFAVPAAANAVSPGDPRWVGQWRFLHDTWGAEQLDGWPPADFMLRLMRDEPAVFGNQFASFGFIADPNDELPFGFKRGVADRTKVNETCALCHVARLGDGRVWLGAPAVSLDLGRFRVEVSRRWVAAGNPPLITELEARKALELGPGRTAAETGSYPQVVPADFPPYFTLGQRTALNYMGTGRNLRSEAYFSIFSFGAGAPNAMTARVPFPSEARVAEFLTFFGAIDPPPAPPGDAAQIARGRSLFERERCGACHHVGEVARDGVTPIDRGSGGDGGVDRRPGDEPSWPRGSVATSPLHRVLQDGDGSDAGVDTGRGDLLRFIFANRLSVQMTDGYRVNDLRGLAHTAPYLHNGSVPTLEDLLRPASQRPRTFTRGAFVVDTTRLPNSNRGHEFGASLSDDERSALAAYLRSL